MTPGEIYDTKRNNFIEKTKRNFGFLVSELGFERPNHTFHEQENGSITQDEFRYVGLNKVIVISNAYHPVDYGFEINCIDKQTGQSAMIFSVLKEKQDMEQSYLESASEFLKTELKKV